MSEIIGIPKKEWRWLLTVKDRAGDQFAKEFTSASSWFSTDDDFGVKIPVEGTLHVNVFNWRRENVISWSVSHYEVEVKGGFPPEKKEPTSPHAFELK